MTASEAIPDTAVTAARNVAEPPTPWFDKLDFDQPTADSALRRGRS